MSYITNTPSLHVIVCHLAHKLTHQTSEYRFGYGLCEQVSGQVDTLDPRGTHPSRLDEVRHEIKSSVNVLGVLKASISTLEINQSRAVVLFQ